MARELTAACVHEIMAFGGSKTPEHVKGIVDCAFANPTAAITAATSIGASLGHDPKVHHAWNGGLAYGIAVCILALSPDELAELRHYNQKYVDAKGRRTPAGG